MMGEKTKLLDLYDPHVVAGMIQAKKRSPQLKEVEIYPAILKRAITILGFVAHYPQKSD
jgi:hypothetical protein